MITTPHAETPETRTLFRIMTFSIALSFGALIASLVSLQHNPLGFHFVFDAWTLVSFVLAAVAAGSYWSLLVKFKPKAGQSTATRRGNMIRLILKAVPLLVVGFLGFLYPLKFVSSPEKKLEIAQGLGLAIFALSFQGFLLWRVTRFIDPPQTDSRDE